MTDDNEVHDPHDDETARLTRQCDVMMLALTRCIRRDLEAGHVAHGIRMLTEFEHILLEMMGDEGQTDDQ